MNLEAGDLYHIYNQGNNRVRIFYSRENYFFFLKKIRTHIIPHADILAWCLMPNHFHLMAYVHTLEIEITEKEEEAHSEGFTRSEALTKNTLTPVVKMRDINNSIGILLRSYTRSINEQENTTGSLFRKSTHSECLTTIDLHAPSFLNTPNGTIIKQHFPEKEYPQVCFNYIHNNPVKAGLVKHPGDWEFSSYRDYSGSRNGKMINRKRAEEFGLVID